MIEGLQPGQIFGGYRIEAVAGRGGMGVVYRATQMSLGRTVALKLITPAVAADADFRDRLQRESHLLASIDHPNVITVYEAGESDGQLFMSMRYVNGMDLRSQLVAQGPLPPDSAVRIVAQVAAALDAAHAAGLVHRDVKPANVLLEQRGATQHAYLSDFGLSKTAHRATGITRSGQWVGTVDYAAPEQLDGRPVDARTDVYALGCVLFESLTGRPPYVRESDAAKLWAHMHEAPPSACALRPELPAELDVVIARAMAKQPAHRHQSAGALGHAALAAAGGEALTDPDLSAAAGTAAGPAGHDLGAAKQASTSQAGAPPRGRPGRRGRRFGATRRAVPVAILAILMMGTLLVVWAPWDSSQPRSSDRGEATLVAACSDHRDNDDDGTTDHPQDRGCASGTDATETKPSSRPSPSSSSSPPSPPAERPDDTGEQTPTTSTPSRRPAAERPGGSEKKPTSNPPNSNPPPPPAANSPPSSPPPAANPPPAAVTPPGTPPAAQPTARTACADGKDNDTDGKIDTADPDCTSPADNIEKVAACADGKDNDTDGRIDTADPECSSADDTAEKT